MEIPNKLHLGCGLNTPEGWLNVDISWNARLAKYTTIRKLLGKLRLIPQEILDIRWDKNIYFHDVRKPLPFREGSFIAVYTSHLLEHLYLEEAKSLLKECHRVLKSGGVLRVVVPDLRAFVEEYLHNDVSLNTGETSADILNRRLNFHCTMPSQGNFLYRTYTRMMDCHTHKWMYDVNSLKYYLKLSGFVDVDEKKPFTSDILDIDKVELSERTINRAGICVEGKKT